MENKNKVGRPPKKVSLKVKYDDIMLERKNHILFSIKKILTDFDVKYLEWETINNEITQTLND